MSEPVAFREVPAWLDEFMKQRGYDGLPCTWADAMWWGDVCTVEAMMLPDGFVRLFAADLAASERHYAQYERKETDQFVMLYHHEIVSSAEEAAVFLDYIEPIIEASEEAP